MSEEEEQPIEEEQVSAVQLNKPNQVQQESQSKEKKQAKEVLCVYNEDQNRWEFSQSILVSQIYTIALSFILSRFIIGWDQLDITYCLIFILAIALFFGLLVGRLLSSYKLYKKIKKNKSWIDQMLKLKSAQRLDQQNQNRGEPSNLFQKNYYSLLTHSINYRLVQYKISEITLIGLITMLISHLFVLFFIPNNEKDESKVALYLFYFFQCLLGLLDIFYFLRHCSEICQLNTLEDSLEKFKQNSIKKYKQTRKIQEDDIET